jgi:hypothetical protein
MSSEQLPSWRSQLTPNKDGLVCTNQYVPVQLPGLPSPIYISCRCGKQKEPDHSDQLVAIASIALPIVGGNSGHLIPELRFGDRIRLLGESLCQSWGIIIMLSMGTYRVAKQASMGNTWLAALKTAEANILQNIDGLFLTLSRRCQALDSEGVEYLLEARLIEASETKESSRG